MQMRKVNKKQKDLRNLKIQRKRTKFHRQPVQNQMGGTDCGYFAIVFAVSVYLGPNPS